MNKYLLLAQRSHTTSQIHEWRLAFVAYRVPNKAELSRLLIIDPAQITRWAYAYRMFLYIGDGCSYVESRRLRRAISRGHFTRLQSLWNKYEFSPREAKEYLEDALHARWGSGRMAIEVEALELGGGGMWGDWKRYTSGLRGLLDKLRVPFGFPDRFAERAEELSTAVKRFTHEVDEERKRL